jgi:hypothetical protein
MNYDQQAPTAGTSPVLLSVEDAARELNLRYPVAVNRLIARRRLDATRVGVVDGANEGEWKIRREALSQYVAQGAPDLDPPRIDGAWFAQDLQQAARPFPQSLSAAAADGSQRLSDKQLLEASKGTEQVYVALKVTDAMRRIIGAPVPRNPIPSAKPLRGQFTTFGDLWLAAALQDVASASVDQIHGPNGVKQRLASGGAIGGPRMYKAGQQAPRIALFYASPDEYEAAVAIAVANTLQRKVFAFSEQRVVDRGSFPGDPRNKVTVTYTLPVSSFATKPTLDRLANVAAF